MCSKLSAPNSAITGQHSQGSFIRAELPIEGLRDKKQGKGSQSKVKSTNY